LEEAVTCIRPTEAEPLKDGTYRVLPTPNYDPTDEVWEFQPGSIVHCESFDGSLGPHLLAIGEAGGDGKKKGRAAIAVLEDGLTYRDEYGHTLWNIKSESVVLVAEYATNECPFGDDWFWYLLLAPAPSTLTARKDCCSFCKLGSELQQS